MLQRRFSSFVMTPPAKGIAPCSHTLPALSYCCWPVSPERIPGSVLLGTNPVLVEPFLVDPLQPSPRLFGRIEVILYAPAGLLPPPNKTGQKATWPFLVSILDVPIIPRWLS